MLKTMKQRARRTKSNVVPFPRSSASTRRLRALSAVHSQEVVSGKVLAFSANSRDDFLPSGGGNAPALLPLTKNPDALADLGGHVWDRGPTSEDVVDSTDGLTALHAVHSAGDDLSRQGVLIRPGKEEGANGTIGPMLQKKDARARRHDHEFGQQLLSAREELGKTQEQMARMLGMREDRYKKAEQGTRGFPAEYIQTLCAITKKDANFFFRIDTVSRARTGSA